MGESKDKLDVARAEESIANAKEHGTWPKGSETLTKEATPPFVVAVTPSPPTRTHVQAMAAFHNIEKEDQGRQPEKANAQELGTRPQDNETLTREITPPPAVPDAPKLPIRTHEQAMAAFHNIQNPPTRTHVQAMAAFHNIEKEDQGRQPEKAIIQHPPIPPQIDETPVPTVTEKKNIFERLSAWMSGKS